ncbi:MAG: hypothetical protein IPJ55_17070 [Chloracidobacterium sp.]|nr:hypothetical protein [Chloracidobacterium sp.]
MTIGTNANLEEKVKYFPFEVDFEQVLEALEKLDAWEDNGYAESPNELKGIIEDHYTEVADFEAEIKRLNDENADFEMKVFNLEAKVSDLEGEVADLKIELKEQL